MIAFYSRALFNPNWGEQIRFLPGNRLEIAMVFQGLDQQQAAEVWAPFLAEVKERPHDYSLETPLKILSIPAQRFWDAEFMMANRPEFINMDDRPGARKGDFVWAGDQGEAGQFIHSYRSAWLPATLLERDQQKALSDALVAASHHWGVALHFNKALAGAPQRCVVEGKGTAINPAMLDSFALAIAASHGPPAYPGVIGHEPDASAKREGMLGVAKAMDELLTLAPNAGSYISESDFFEPDWQRLFWGPNYERLAAVKQLYDPGGLFTVHHGVGSEQWSSDGFVRRCPARLEGFALEI